MDVQNYYLTQGVLGATVVVLMIACGYLFKLLMEEKDKRLSDAKEIKTDVTEALGSIKTTMNSMLSLLQVIANSDGKNK